MKKTLVTTVALAACVTTQLFAQNVKQDNLTLSFTVQSQSSVSTKSGSANNGTWSEGPAYYKTTSKKYTQTDLLRNISYVLHGGNPNFYASSAKLVVVQAELGGFFNVSSNLSVAEPLVVADGTFDTTTFNVANGSTISGLTMPKLSSGRHMTNNPLIAAASALSSGKIKDESSWPVGHHQPWGQIYVQDTTKSPMLCENVTFFFNVTVQECYDCFYLNSFISDASFKFSTTTQAAGPPCCVSVKSGVTGNGRDRYYMTLSFDNSDNNPYLNPNYPEYTGFQGIARDTIPGDGVEPDAIPYVDVIASGVSSGQPYIARWTLNGIVNYSWNFKLVNSTDLVPDYVGSASYPAYGYGFIGLICSFMTGTANFSETIVKSSSCCLASSLPWYSSWYGSGWHRADEGLWAPLNRVGTPYSTTAANYDSTTYSYVDGYLAAVTPVNAPVDMTTHVDFNQRAPRNP